MTKFDVLKNRYNVSYNQTITKKVSTKFVKVKKNKCTSNYKNLII